MSFKIAVFVDGRYVPIAQNWLAAMRRIGLETNVLLVTLDAESERAFERTDIERLFRPLLTEKLEDLWIHRIRVLAGLLADGHDIVHSDADAVWLSNPLGDLLSPDYDLVFSQGTIWPPDVHERRGLVLCCGLFSVRASARTLSLFDELARRVTIERDDQIAINRLLDEKLGEWKIARPRFLRFGDKNFVTSDEVINSSDGALKVGVLPFHRYPRIISSIDGVIVAHPLSGKTCAETQEKLAECGLWCI